MRKLLNTLTVLMMCILCNALKASTSASECESAAEQAAKSYYLTTPVFGELKVHPKSVEIKGSVTTEVIAGQRYKTCSQAHIAYTGSTGGDTSEVKNFVMIIEADGNKLRMVKFEEIRDRR